jgi:hypothetical protein
MFHGCKGLQLAALLVSGFMVGPLAANAQQSEAASCAETMTDQLRRFSEKCLSDLVAFVGSQTKMGARVSGETEKFYVVLVRDGDGVRAEAVSKHNYPFMKEETANTLKQLGWTPPENESDNWRRFFTADRLKGTLATEDVVKALAAYGLQPGQAMTLTVAPEITN